ncbi:CP2 transcription factor-domain-containing protein [Absidia repens]|uniref:CP2 transcription factor-domain-containing protein n=1 Tax=Absidia repens TaxID=90262 RepID=A0A1X2ISG4_9FUNG|nr:CP2 transcription factor-domain-containing protein [Absidia repens]
MLASEYCNSAFYDSQHHSVKMDTDYNFKQESDLLLDNGSTAATSANATTTAASSSTSSPSSNMVAYQTNQQYQQHIQQMFWNKQQYSTTTTTTVDNSYPTDDLFYASLPPPPPAPPMSTLPSLPKKNYLAKRHHPRHHSANGILQQYNHYHQQQQQLQSSHQSQYHLTYPHQRQLSSSTVTSTNSPTTDLIMSSSCVSTGHYPTITSTLSSPTNSSYSPMSPSSILKQSQNDDSQDKLSSVPSSARPPLRYEILLQASTAAAQRFGESSSMTYLNRGQAYGLQFVDQNQNQQPSDVLVTSTISITFHDATHRQASQNYWRFWLSQQDRPNEARALDLDAQQSSGLVNVHYPSFDRITFQWQPQAGATLFVRFNCLSTDFSRIKGVKGIPLRAVVESMETPSSNVGVDEVANCIEKSFCKIKLFRDKGAERKNKDDAKQIAKQLEKLKAEGNPQHNPLWQFYNRPVFPYSTFEALADEDVAIKSDFPMTLTTTPTPPLSIPTVASNIETSSVSYSLPPPPPSISTTSPSSLSSLSPTSLIEAKPMVSPIQSFSQNNGSHNQLQHHYQQSDTNMTIVSPFYSSSFSYPVNYAQTSSPSFMYDSITSPPLTSSSLAYPQQLQQQSWSSSNISPVVGMKRSRSHLATSYSDHPSPPDEQPAMKKFQDSLPALTLFVDTKKTQPSMEYKRIELDTLTVQQLVMKLSTLFSLQAQRVTEVLWRRDSSATINNNPLEAQQKKSANQLSGLNVLVVVEDCVLEQFPDRSNMTVQWEISADGTVRFILEF